GIFAREGGPVVWFGTQGLLLVAMAQIHRGPAPLHLWGAARSGPGSGNQAGARPGLFGLSNTTPIPGG
ncbi:unnamed protein product, partial [Amoebophrya sp. A120]